MGLELDKDIQIKDLQVFVDSLLLTNHFDGSYAVKGERLALYLKILKKLASEFEALSLSQVPREDNVEAGALSNLLASLRILP